jgi:apolipoprotein D and lipocalin family protein
MNLRKVVPLILFTAFMLSLAGCGEDTAYPPLTTVSKVDLNRYLGRWYEIARIDHSFQKGCVASTAEYSLREDGDIRVINSCRKISPTGKISSVEGRVWIMDKDTNAWLKVQFFWPFAGDYVIIDLDSNNYNYAVVGHPSRNYLWVLSRTPQMEDGLYDEVMKRIAGQGYDLKRIKKYDQVNEKK